MTTIICDISAWEYWRTPPILRDGIDLHDAAGDPLEHAAHVALPPLRANAREADRLVRERLLTDLKGVSLPVCVMTDSGNAARSTALIHAFRIPKALPRNHVVPLGNGLSVLSPELTVASHAQRRGLIPIAKMMFEACGIFTLLPSNERIDFALEQLTSQGVLTRESCAQNGIFGYYDESGRPNSFLDRAGRPLPWIPAFDRLGRLTDLWKRPPLTTVQDIGGTMQGLDGLTGVTAAKKALRIVRDGAASPAEVYAHLLLCSGTWHGGESWGDPLLNRRVGYTPTARALAGRSFGIADFHWENRMCDLEVDSESFHADELGFKEATGRRAAFEHMGYEVGEITYSQMADLELFDAVLPSLAKRLSFPLQKRTAAFLRRRDSLHRKLFGSPYEPDHLV